MLMILWTTSNKYLSYEDEDNPIMINIDAHVIPKIKL